MYTSDGDYIQDIEVNDLRNRYLLTKGSTQKMVNTTFARADCPHTQLLFLLCHYKPNLINEDNEIWGDIRLTMGYIARVPPAFAALADSVLKYRSKTKPALVRFPPQYSHFLLVWNEQQLTLARYHHARQLLPEQEHGNSSGESRTPHKLEGRPNMVNSDRIPRYIST